MQQQSYDWSLSRIYSQKLNELPGLGSSRKKYGNGSALLSPRFHAFIWKFLDACICICIELWMNGKQLALASVRPSPTAGQQDTIQLIDRQCYWLAWRYI